MRVANHLLGVHLKYSHSITENMVHNKRVVMITLELYTDCSTGPDGGKLGLHLDNRNIFWNSNTSVKSQNINLNVKIK